MGEKSTTYDDGVLAETYAWGLMIHEYIPQADQGIVDSIQAFVERRKKESPVRILDLGMGPGRLTSRFAQIPNTTVVGLDNSPRFVEAARNRKNPQNVEYVLLDFLEYETSEKFDVIVMQGIFHHVHGEERQLWLAKMHSMLAPGGVLIVGDEFIPDYESEEERRARAGLFYAHIIGDAQKAQAYKNREQDLAKEECINLIADVLSGEDVCGYYDDTTIRYIKRRSAYINSRLFFLDDRRITGDEAAREVNELIAWIRSRARLLKEAGALKQIDRGDYKVSPEKLAGEFSAYFKEDKKKTRKFGPFDEIGGMGVVVYQAK